MNLFSAALALLPSAQTAINQAGTIIVEVENLKSERERVAESLTRTNMLIRAEAMWKHVDNAFGVDTTPVTDATIDAYLKAQATPAPAPSPKLPA